MDARTLSIKTIFGQDRRHLVLLFQRPYVWTQTDQWDETKILERRDTLFETATIVWRRPA